MMITVRQVLGATPSVVARYEGGVLTVNDAPVDPGAVIEYGESCATISDDPSVRFEVEALPSEPEPTTDPVDYVPPPPDSCTVLQGRRALGMVRVNQIDQLVKHLDLLLPELSPEEIWEIQTAWEYGTTWLRLGREVNMLREIYGMSEQERDDLMRLANTY